VVHQATTEAAIHLDVADGRARIGLAATRRISGELTVSVTGREIFAAAVTLDPATPFAGEVDLPEGTAAEAVRVELAEQGRLVLGWQPRAASTATLPTPATQPPAPAEVEQVEELYLIGLHLAQYRHATRRPEHYWEEAIRRDPADVRSLTALAAAEHERGLLESAEQRLRRVVDRLTRWNPNPADGEPLYRLGLVLQDLGRPAEAYPYLAKAAWNDAWKRAAWLAMARIDCAGGRYDDAEGVTATLLATDPTNSQAAALRTIVLRHLNRADEAAAVLAAARLVHPIDAWLTDLGGEVPDVDAATLVDVADEFVSCGQRTDALRVLALAAEREISAPVEGAGNQLPLIALRQADLLRELADPQAEAALTEALTVDRTRCFPGRLTDALLLERIRDRHPDAALPAALHGHWLYAHGRGEEALDAWAVAADDPVCLRNRGVASFNVSLDPEEAIRCYDAALAVAPTDPKLWFERDQLAKATGESVAARLARLEPQVSLVSRRDDLTVEYATLLTGADRAAEAVQFMTGRTFQPWEGGEGAVLGAWEGAHALLARQALATGEPGTAVAHVRAALTPPPTLGEDRHLLATVAELELLLGDALAAVGDSGEATAAWERAARAEGDFVSMATQPFSPRSYASQVARQRLGRDTEATDRAQHMLAWAQELAETPATIDYFATSLPSLLLFHTDVQAAHDVTALLIQAQACAVLERFPEARAKAMEVLSRDPSQTLARDLLWSIGSAADNLSGPLTVTKEFT
ncbi:MAG: tetratricopeptide repeat protein, partial [Propioniciclava sp.]